MLKKLKLAVFNKGFKGHEMWPMYDWLVLLT